MVTSVRNAFGNARFDTTTTTPSVAATEPPKGAAEPSAPRTLPTNPSAMGRDEFLKMLVAQLKNQDPLNPMDGKDMAAQLAQFSTVEQLITMNKSIDEQKAAAAQMTDAIESLQETQNQRADELATLIEGQMAMATVGKIGVTAGNNAFVDRDGTGTIMVNAGSLTGTGRITMIDSTGATVGQALVGPVKQGQQAFDVGDYKWDPPLKPGKYTFKFEVAKDGNPYVAATTYTAGRITGMRYQDGNPILMIGDSISVPMSQLTQIRA